MGMGKIFIDFSRYCLLRRVVPKSYRLEVRSRSTSNEFPSRVIIGNCRLLQYDGLFQYHHLRFTNSQATC